LAQVVELIHCGCNRFVIIRAAPNRRFHSHSEIRTDLRLALEILPAFGINMHPIYFSGRTQNRQELFTVCLTLEGDFESSHSLNILRLRGHAATNDPRTNCRYHKSAHARSTHRRFSDAIEHILPPAVGGLGAINISL
jgi:hypothetical protein